MNIVTTNAYREDANDLVRIQNFCIHFCLNSNIFKKRLVLVRLQDTSFIPKIVRLKI
jgi:hypothetical protein